MKSYNLGLLFLIMIMGTSCEKKFLDKKPSTGILLPQTLDDLQMILDNYQYLNLTTCFGNIAADEYYIKDDVFQASNMLEQLSYTWEKDFNEKLGPYSIESWEMPFRTIFYSNVALENLKKVERTATNQLKWDYIKGAALFMRAYAYFDMTQTFCAAYDEGKAATEPGLPLRSNPDIDDLQPRASLQATYQFFLQDFHEAIPLLAPAIPMVRTRPSKPAVFAALSRVYLNMRNYEKAEAYADSCLSLYHQLIDYNTISTTSATPFPRDNAENIIAYKAVNGYSANFSTSDVGIIDSNLYNSYDDADLRKQIFFRTSNSLPYIKRGYWGTQATPFSGLATDEVYLNKAECLARRGEVTAAMDTVNALLLKRWNKNAVFTPLTATNSTEALNIVLDERRKELVFRGQRLPDIKRLNLEGANITLKRVINGQEFTLPPNDRRAIMPIPLLEIEASGIEQTPR
ncbi:MAG: RagB/SusD family nutrient uptake outer membrane protein [Pseudobacter sp.]|uniref:RagB/SusD family nutrient uptake outer membrane protein n=1 Tax=Pseudobacter sp. TaxID=2045420 RepID=UPI003F7DF0D2